MPNPIMKHFEYAHLPPFLQEVSKPVGELAKLMDETLPDCAEKSVGLRKLLEAKDALVRAKLEEPKPNDDNYIKKMDDAGLLDGMKPRISI